MGQEVEHIRGDDLDRRLVDHSNTEPVKRQQRIAEYIYDDEESHADLWDDR